MAPTTPDAPVPGRTGRWDNAPHMETSERSAPASLPQARAALEAHRWEEAYGLLMAADAVEPLAPEDLQALAQASWFTGRADFGIEVKERAFKAYAERGDAALAAIFAFDLAREYANKRKISIAAAWGGRGERLLKDQPESAAHGYLALWQSNVARSAGDVDGAVKHAERALDIGTRFGDRDLQAWALLAQGAILISVGRTDEGFPLLEEATIAAVNGEIGPFAAGVAYCGMISACRDTTDYRRASEWTEAAHRWCERQAISGFPGICRVHSAEIVALQGALDRAEQELLRATEELAAYNAAPPLADGFYALGEIRYKLGDVVGAEESLRQAHALGRSPQPALALIRLGEGKIHAAATAINSAVAEETTDLWARARLLPAQVEIAIAAADLDTASAAADELTTLADSRESPVLRAVAQGARGRLLLAEGDAEAAARELRAAMRDWQEVGAPYEVAKDRAVLASALFRLDQDDRARLELEATRAEFARLGAVRDEQATADALRGADERDAAPARVRMTFVFTDIVGSTKLAEALGDEAWEVLLRWHDETLRALFERDGGDVVQSTGDGFFVAFDSAQRALECAVAIQRALAEHRRATGFAPSVRIGVHAADAHRRGHDYSGKGVHVAARIAALAESGEVLASRETAAAASGAFTLSEPRAVALKGVSEPVDVVALRWV
jgi:class 3 adenylate cyclase